MAAGFDFHPAAIGLSRQRYGCVHLPAQRQSGRDCRGVGLVDSHLDSSQPALYWAVDPASKIENLSLKEMIGFRKGLLIRDILWGLLWSLALGALLMAGIFSVVLVLYGFEGLANLEGVFVGKADFSFDLPAWLAVISGIAFPLFNPLVEELQYRGYALTRLQAVTGSPWLGILITAVGFGVQHVVFAVTFSSALAYTVGFFLWGLGAGYIALRQRRLVALIVAHFISNLSFGIIPLILIARGG
jgi:uncharacterized protein